MSKERARRRAQRLAVLEKEKAARARKVARRQRRRAVVRRLTPRVGRSGRLHRRGRAERLAVAVVPLVVLAGVWLFVPSLALRVVLTFVLVIVVPVLIFI